MMRAAFIISILILFVFSLWRYMTGFFIDNNSLKESFDSQIPYLICGALILGIMYLLFFIKAFPVGWNKQSSGGQLGIIVVFLILAFAIIRQSSITLNFILPKKNNQLIKVIVLNKNVEKTNKGTKFYSLSLQQFHDKRILSFDVSKNEYEKYAIGDTLQKEIITGYFDIKYAKQ